MLSSLNDDLIENTRYKAKFSNTILRLFFQSRLHRMRKRPISSHLKAQRIVHIFKDKQRSEKGL